MKKILFLLMLAVSTATISSAQINCVASNGLLTDTITNADSTYFTTPANALNAATSGKYVVAVTTNRLSGTGVLNVILEGTIDGTYWFKMHNTPGADGVNCDSLLIPTTAGAFGFKLNCTPGSVKVAYGTTYYTGTSRVIRLRAKLLGAATQSTKIVSVKVLTAL